MVKWISVHEQLPKDNEHYLVLDMNNQSHIGHLDIDGEWFDDDGILIKRVTHWVCLPKLPENNTFQSLVAESDADKRK